MRRPHGTKKFNQTESGLLQRSPLLILPRLVGPDEQIGEGNKKFSLAISAGRMDNVQTIETVR
jgi:hypothetical protein